MSLALLPLWPYQRQCIDAFQERWSDRAFRLACEIPTGGGKTFIFAHMAKEHVEKYGTGVLILVHTDELAEQAYADLCGIAPHLNVGIVKAKRNDVDATVIIGSVQTLRNQVRRDPIKHIGLVIVDECHHSAARSYMDILTHFGCFSNKCRAAGFTATMVRADGQGLGHIWGHELVFHRDISWMVRKGYLIPPRGMSVQVPDLNLAGVKANKNDFQDGALGDAMAESLAPAIVAQAYLEHAGERKAVGFAPTIASAYVFSDAFNEHGIKSEVVHSKLPDEERKAILDRHKASVTRVVWNVGVLTEGYNDPEISCVIQARPTKNKGLYIQMVGRGLRVDRTRPYEDQDCLILNVTGANNAMDLRSVADLSVRPLKEANNGKTLIELEDEFDEVERDPEHFYHGPVEVVEFDPLAARNTKTWLKTKGGTFFVPAGKEAYVFIMQWPKPGQWSVAWCTKDPREKRFLCEAEDAPSRTCTHKEACPQKVVATTQHRGLDLEVALTWAEDLAVDMGATPGDMNLANKKAPWRRGKPTDKTVRFARSLGIEVPATVDPETGLETPTVKAGILSDQVTTLLASRRIDPLVAKVRGVK